MATMRNKLLPVSRTELGVTMKVVDGTKELSCEYKLEAVKVGAGTRDVGSPHRAVYHCGLSRSVWMDASFPATSRNLEAVANGTSPSDF